MKKSKEKDYDRIIKVLINSFLNPWFFVIILWIVILRIVTLTEAISSSAKIVSILISLISININFKFWLDSYQNFWTKIPKDGDITR